MAAGRIFVGPARASSRLFNNTTTTDNISPRQSLSCSPKPNTNMDYERYDDEEEEEGDPLPPKVEELAQASVPTTLKGVRACMRCGIIKTLDQFLEYG